MNPENKCINNNQSEIENFSFGILRVDAGGQIIYANNTFLELLQFQSFEDLQAHYQFNNQLRDCFSPGRLAIYENKDIAELYGYKWKTKTGKTLLLHEQINAVKNGNNLLYYDCIVRKCSETSMLDKIISDITSTDNSILKAIPDFIFVVSREGKIIENKNNYSDLFPHIYDIAGKTLEELFNRETSLQMLALITRTLYSGEMETMEVVTNMSGETSFFEARFVIRNIDEVVMLLRNITLQRKIESRLEKLTAELMQSNITKDKFFSIISHDLRTPINGILNYAEILSGEVDLLAKKEIKEFTNSIIEIARSTNGLLTNLLEWSRVQSGEIAFAPCGLRINDLLEKVINLVIPSANKKQLHIENELPPNLNLYADENMISSIFLNLIGNAIKFTMPGGKIEISAIDAVNKIVFSISDSGIGISDENKNKLFNSGITFTTIGTEKERGTGLGLLLCKEFVKKHDGDIWIDSKVGQGTIFYFSLSKQLQPEIK